MRSPWAREYARRPKDYVWGIEPSSFAREVSELLPPAARVLDLGCGEGRDSVFFASRGFQVTGVDASRAGLRKGERLARERGTAVRWLHRDMAQLALDDSFDLVYSCGSIHYVSRRERDRLFPRLKAVTRPNGYHAHIVFTDRIVYREKGEVLDYFVAGELARAYTNWLILRLEERTIPCSQDGVPHRHSVELILSKAVGGGPAGTAAETPLWE